MAGERLARCEVKDRLLRFAQIVCRSNALMRRAPGTHQLRRSRIEMLDLRTLWRPHPASPSPSASHCRKNSNYLRLPSYRRRSRPSTPQSSQARKIAAPTGAGLPHALCGGDH